MKSINIIMFTSIILLMSCKTKEEKVANNTSENPLLSEWNTPFGVPPFDIIKNSDYKPAFDIAIAEHKSEIDKIINNSEPATFENTIEALEMSGKSLNRVSSVFYALNSAHTNDSIKALAGEMAPIFSAHSDDINLNKDLFKRVKTVYDAADKSKMSGEQYKLLEDTYKGFVRSGVSLEGEKEERLRTINSRLAELADTFGKNVLAETNAYDLHVTNKEDLGNLSSSLVALAADEAKARGHENGWSFTVQRPSINPFLQSSPNRELRKKIFDAYAMRGDNDNENDNKAILQEMASLRVEKANLLGYETHSHLVLEERMAKNPDAVYKFMDQLWEPVLNVAKEERAAMAAFMKKDGAEGVFNGSDWRHYVEKVRKERYDFDEDEMRPYFEFNAVKNGAFELATKLFGLTFKELKDIPKWHPDQQVYEVLEADGKHLGVIYMDFFARESKRGGAWMNELRAQSNVNGNYVTPIVTNNFNFPRPTETEPSLLSFSDAETMFHEFGHGLHGLFSNVTYESQSGTNVPRDFVEFPSQVMENWMSEPEVLKLYAKHYKTGEVIPDALIKKMNDANSFNSGFANVEYMAAAYLDMAWHTLKDTKQRDARQFEKEQMDKLGLIPEIIPRYRSGYFNHIFSSPVGYSSGYYSYKWSEVLDADAFAAFKEAGSIFDQETAKKYRKMLSLGGSKEGMELYKGFRGKEPSIDPLLVKLGIK
ncbi:M3 family metallopeptidase [Urechidicola croceus]|uniref:Peptidase M3 n=1 Tax=Urechidicola croceus TaxID=1850246 RepID=A0A1D8P7U2_9FLAO|nr:M3 family metallopeptidase [Urechidicola croceus]AOW20649.1 peptidase M3 [Urechidicola croceus]